VTEGLIGKAEEVWQLGTEIEKIEVGVPDSIKQMIEKQVGYLSKEEQRMLEAASVSGVEFSTLTVAAGLGEDAAVVETQCEELARRHQFIRDCGFHQLPSGEVAARYGFIHALYQNVLYERVSAAKRVHLHRRVGERGEELYGEKSGEIAAELAMHFERGRDYPRAVQYRQQAGENALRRSAHREAIDHLTKGLELLQTLPDTPERTQQELTLQITLGPALMATKGYAAPELEKAYARARELCRQVGETPQLFSVLWGLWGFYVVRMELQTGYELAEQLLTVAQSVQDPAFLVGAHQALGVTLFHLGKMAPARTHLEQGIALYEPRQHCSLAFLYGQDPGVACRSFAALILWFLGYPDQALQRSHEAVTLAKELSYPFSRAFALALVAWLHHFRREAQAAQERTEAVLALTREHGFTLLSAFATLVHGWTQAEQGQAEEGIAWLHQGLVAFRATGSRMSMPNHPGLLAEACGQAGQTEEGLSVLAEALAEVDKTGESYYEAELYRLKGELTLKQSRVQSLESEAESCFHQAIAIARRQSAKSLELRAVMSLARLYQKQGRKEEARRMLEETYGWFTEGFDTADLKEAKEMLDQLS
jgi:predicted ATPase